MSFIILGVLLALWCGQRGVSLKVSSWSPTKVDNKNLLPHLKSSCFQGRTVSFQSLGVLDASEFLVTYRLWWVPCKKQTLRYQGTFFLNMFFCSIRVPLIDNMDRWKCDDMSKLCNFFHLKGPHLCNAAQCLKNLGLIKGLLTTMNPLMIP